MKHNLPHQEGGEYDPITNWHILAIVAMLVCFGICVGTKTCQNDTQASECSMHPIEYAAEAEPTEQDITDDILTAQYEAVRHMESRGNRFAYNSRGNARGPVQITPIMLREFQRITGRAADIMPTIDDCFDEEISRMIFDTVILYHNPELDIYETAEIWHPGHSRRYMDELINQLQKRM